MRKILKKIRPVTEADIRYVLRVYDKGVLSNGSHQCQDGEFCALEAISMARGIIQENKNAPTTKLKKVKLEDLEQYFSDDPDYVGYPDLRNLNDAYEWKDDADRTKKLVPLLAALSNYENWGAKRFKSFKSKLLIFVVQNILPDVVGKDGLELCGDAKGPFEEAKHVSKRDFKRMCRAVTNVTQALKCWNMVYVSDYYSRQWFPDLNAEFSVDDFLRKKLTRCLDETSGSDAKRRRRLHLAVDCIRWAAEDQPTH